MLWAHVFTKVLEFAMYGDKLTDNQPLAVSVSNAKRCLSYLNLSKEVNEYLMQSVMN